METDKMINYSNNLDVWSEELMGWRNELTGLQTFLAFHMRKDHNGFIATTCHRCLINKQHILFLEEDICNMENRIRKNIEGLHQE